MLQKSKVKNISQHSVKSKNNNIKMQRVRSKQDKWFLDFSSTTGTTNIILDIFKTENFCQFVGAQSKNHQKCVPYITKQSETLLSFRQIWIRKRSVLMDMIDMKQKILLCYPQQANPQEVCTKLKVLLNRSCFEGEYFFFILWWTCIPCTPDSVTPVLCINKIN